MKRFSLYLLFYFFAVNAFAQSAAQAFDVNGLKVIWKPTNKDILHVSIYYRGGVTNYPAEKAGIENLTLAAATDCGTAKFTKDEFKDLADAYDIKIGGTSGYDYGNISVNCITKYAGQAWQLLAEAVNHPVFNESEFALLKNKIIAGVKSGEADPDTRIDELTVLNSFGTTAYVTNPKGNEKSLTAISAGDAKDYYYNTLLNKSRMFVVVVGKTSKDELMKRVQEAFGSLPKSTYTPAVYKTPVYKTNKFLSEERDLATNYITGAFNAPRMIEAGYVPYKLAVAALSERLFTEIRTKRNLSYAPYAYSANRMLPFGVMYVTTTQPKEAVQIMVNELKKIKAQGFTPTELQNAKSHFITSNYMKEESSAAIAASLGTAEVLGDWKIAEAMPEKVMHVTLEDMNRSLGNIDTINWSYLGNKKAADDATGIFNMTVSAVK